MRPSDNERHVRRCAERFAKKLKRSPPPPLKRTLALVLFMVSGTCPPGRHVSQPIQCTVTVAVAVDLQMATETRPCSASSCRITLAVSVHAAAHTHHCQPTAVYMAPVVLPLACCHWTRHRKSCRTWVWAHPRVRERESVPPALLTCSPF
eukprot:Rmarinus@m.28897